MIALSGFGGAVGTGFTGPSAVGCLKKRPEVFGNALVLACVPTSQVLYGFVGFIIFQNALGGGQISILNGAITLGAGIALGIVCLITCIHQARVCANGISAMASGTDDVLGKTLILAAVPEFFAILSLVAAILLSQMLVA
jgi:V/A-type H+-transporting ATPase subunit K